MKPLINLTLGGARAWFRMGRAWTRGYAFQGNTLHAAADLARFVESFDGSLEEALSQLRGEFAIVVEREDGTVSAAVDGIRSIPLFYACAGGFCAVSDDAWHVADCVGIEVGDEVDILAFLLQGTTLGSNTLLKDVRQVRAGEVVRLQHESVTQSTYLDVGARRSELESIPEEELVDIGVSIVENVFDRMLRSCDRPLVVPLSGGLDSRLVATMLQRSGRGDTVCYSYGRLDSFDAQTSRHVARRLGFRWEFVPYGRRQWTNWAGSSAFKAYRRQASQFCSIEHEQDWPAILTLASRGLIPRNATFVPGHSGDFLAGSHFPPSAFSGGDPQDWIAHKYLNLWPTEFLGDSRLRSLRAGVESTFRAESLPHERFDDYGWRHRQAMMIANSVRGYEDHGFDWRLPLWDRDMFSFWSSVPLSHRRDKSLYRKVVRRLLGDLMDVPFVAPQQGRLARVRSIVRDGGFYRHAIFGGPSLVGHMRPLASVMHPKHPLCINAVAAWRHMPLLRARINGLLALAQLRDSLDRIEKRAA